mmetsp:Transcript_2453/g.8754  ORF Transcript_2453/g.8754 Transcript_2453/m.8754 type:complete len:247 (+) Transcript_2453:482-1222(+)
MGARHLRVGRQLDDSPALSQQAPPHGHALRGRKAGLVCVQRRVLGPRLQHAHAEHLGPPRILHRVGRRRDDYPRHPHAHCQGLADHRLQCRLPQVHHAGADRNAGGVRGSVGGVGRLREVPATSVLRLRDHCHRQLHPGLDQDPAASASLRPRGRASVRRQRDREADPHVPPVQRRCHPILRWPDTGRSSEGFASALGDVAVTRSTRDSGPSYVCSHRHHLQTARRERHLSLAGRWWRRQEALSAA